MKVQYVAACAVFLSMLSACESTTSPGQQNSPQTEPNTQTQPSAAVTAVSVSGQPGSYTFSVTVESPDTDCSQFADWWEVITPAGDLLYRRVLLHSHVGEQPFSRSGGPVNITAEEPVLVRAHMNNSGYGTQVYSGSINEGLVPDTLDAEFAAVLETTEPLPTGCAF